MGESTIVCSNVVSQDQGLFNRISANRNPGANKLIDRKANEVLETDRSLVHGLHVAKCQDDQTKLCAQLLELIYLQKPTSLWAGHLLSRNGAERDRRSVAMISYMSQKKTESN